jgi:glycosyltransferase involved in cell wall biosynthesis
MTRIGVLITYYGERDLLRECLQSLVEQSVPPDEILVYDDASEAPAEEYVLPGQGVRVLRGDVNRGPAFGRNALLRSSESSVVHFHDADDLFHPLWCARVREAFESTDVDVVFTEVCAIRDARVEQERVLGVDRLARGDDLVRFCIRGAMLTPSGTYRRQVVQEIGGYRTDLAQSEDYDFHIRLAARGVRWTVITDPLVIQRLRSGGRHHRSVEVWSGCMQAILGLSSQLPSRYRPDLADAAVRAGSQLYKLGARSEASAAFKLAAQLGPPCFSTHRRLYRLLSRAFGFQTTEQLGRTYRRVMPNRLRAYVADRGW